jgi:Family of unknown function (DUF6526)
MTDSPNQSYATHRQIVPLYHVVLFGLLMLTLIGAAVNLYESLGSSERLYSASLIVVLTFATILLAFFSRAFALKAQDRAIRAEEQLRHYVLTAAPLDRRLTMRQIVGLRFASDEEFVALAGRAVGENLSEDAIKQAISTWRPDTDRA